MIVEFSKHKDSNARGRNGYFIPAEAFVNGWSERKGVFACPALVNIDVYSKREARTEPLMLRLTVADARKLQKAIAAAIREAK